MNLRFCSPGKTLPYLLYLILVYILITCWRPAAGQPYTIPSKGLQIKDKIPDLTIQGVLYHTNSEIKLSDFKGKLLIIDFWATWCGPCVSIIPRIDSLQKRFDGKVSFLAVTYQNKKEVLAFREKYSKRNGERIELPEVVGDTVLRKLFPHNALPHYVWIDGEGLVKAITGFQQVNEKEIASFLSKTSTKMEQKSDLANFGYKSGEGSLFDFLQKNHSEYFSKMQQHSFFSPYLDGLGGGESRFTTEADPDGNWRITLTNSSPLSFYQVAYGRGVQFLSMNSVSLEVKDSSRFLFTGSGMNVKEWIRKNTYCYELVVPATMSERVFDIFQDELKHYLWKYEAKIEKRRRKILALVKTSETDKIHTSTDAYMETYDGFHYKMNGGTLAGFVNIMNAAYMQSSPLTLVDQTGFNTNTDLDLEANLSNLKEVNVALSKYHLALIEKEDFIDILVIKERLQRDFH